MSGPYSIAPLARIVHPAKDPARRLILLLRAYFDASYTERPQTAPEGGMTVVAGYLGSEPAWQNVESAWAANEQWWRLKDGFHLSPLLAGRGGVAKADAMKCALSFGKIVEHSRLMSFWGAVRDADWQSSKDFPHPYNFCIRLVLVNLHDEMRTSYPDDSVAVVFDTDAKKPEHQNAADAALQEYRTLSRSPFASLTFAKKAQFPAIRIADIIVGTLRMDWIGYEPEHVDSGSALTRAAHGLGGRGSYWSRDAESRVEEMTRRIKSQDAS